jgi:hypothetical protein
MNDFNTAQKWLYDKIINNGQLSKDKIDSLKIYGWTQEVRDLFTNYNLSLDFKKEIGAFYSYCKESLLTKSSFVMDAFDHNSYMKETDKYRIISDEIHNIKVKISLNLIKRSKVIGKVYNFQTNKLELELEDGTFVEMNGDELKQPEIQLDKSIFPDCWLYVTGDIATLRQNKIDSILNDDNS